LKCSVNLNIIMQIFYLCNQKFNLPFRTQCSSYWDYSVSLLLGCLGHDWWLCISTEILWGTMNWFDVILKLNKTLVSSQLVRNCTIDLILNGVIDVELLFLDSFWDFLFFLLTMGIIVYDSMHERINQVLNMHFSLRHIN